MTKCSRDRIRRSIIAVATTDTQRVNAALAAGADAISLDLEDTVPPERKHEARTMLRTEIERCAPVAEVLVRINGEWGAAEADLDSCVWPGLDGVRLPKAEDPEEIRRIDRRLGELERDRDMPSGTVGISLIIESVRGLFAARELARASDRLAAISLGHEDYARDLGVEPTPEGTESLLAELGLVLVAREAEIHPIGSIGRVESPADALAAARKLRSVGFKGAITTNAALIGPLNQAFSPGPAELTRAREIVTAFESARRDGQGLVVVPGLGMIDAPVAARAQRVLDEADRLG